MFEIGKFYKWKGELNKLLIIELWLSYASVYNIIENKVFTIHLSNLTEENL